MFGLVCIRCCFCCLCSIYVDSEHAKAGYGAWGGLCGYCVALSFWRGLFRGQTLLDLLSLACYSNPVPCNGHVGIGKHQLHTSSSRIHISIWNICLLLCIGSVAKHICLPPPRLHTSERFPHSLTHQMFPLDKHTARPLCPSDHDPAITFLHPSVSTTAYNSSLEVILPFFSSIPLFTMLVRISNAT